MLRKPLHDIQVINRRNQALILSVVIASVSETGLQMNLFLGGSDGDLQIHELLYSFRVIRFSKRENMVCERE